MATGGHLILSFLLLGACHVFETGEIPVTCDELDDCGVTVVPTTGSGIAISATDGTSWEATIFDGPEFNEIQRHASTGDLAGPLAYDPDAGLLYVNHYGAVYRFRQGEDAFKEHMPQEASPVLDMALVTGPSEDGPKLPLLLTEDMIYGWWGDISPIHPERPLTDLRSLAVSPNETLYVLDAGDGDGPDLYTVSNTAPMTTHSENIGIDMSLLGGDLFFHGDELLVCSSDGSVYAIDDIISGDTTNALAYTSSEVSQAVACAYDANLDRYLVATQDGVIYAIMSGEEEQIISLVSDSNYSDVYFF